VGKKRGTQSKHIKRRIEYAIKNGLIFCGGIQNGNVQDSLEWPGEQAGDIFSITFLLDSDWITPKEAALDTIPVIVTTHRDGSIDYKFVNTSDHYLDAETHMWFLNKLEEIVTLYKMGMYQSSLTRRAFNGLFLERLLFTNGRRSMTTSKKKVKTQ
jgi:hypothetical protein